MLNAITIILLAIGFALFLIATFWNPPPQPRYNLLAGGLACWILVELLKVTVH